MANLPLESVIINPLERPTSKDINQAQMQAHADMRLLARELFYGGLGSPTDGFVGASFKPLVLFSSSRALILLPGVMFQNKADDELNIGGIQGLNDVYKYKAGYNYEGITIVIDNPPTTVGYSRKDLIQVRVPYGDDRLKDQTATGIFDPTLKTFSSEEKYKLLSSTIPNTYQTIPAGTAPGTATGKVIYKIGTAAASPSEPTPESGYLTVAVVTSTFGQSYLQTSDISDQRNLLVVNPSVGGTGSTSTPSFPLSVSNGGTGQTSLTSGNILLGNGTESITSISVLPMFKGGTGRAPTSGDLNGSIAYLDYGAAQIKYTQAQNSGYLLQSNASGAPTWIAPGAAGGVLTSTGTAWEKIAPVWVSSTTVESVTISGATYRDTWVEISGFRISNIALKSKPTRIRMQAPPSLETSFEAFTNYSDQKNALIKIEIVGPTSNSYVSNYALKTPGIGQSAFIPLSFPALDVNLAEGSYTFKVYAQISGTGDSYGMILTNCVLVVSQG